MTAQEAVRIFFQGYECDSAEKYRAKEIIERMADRATPTFVTNEATKLDDLTCPNCTAVVSSNIGGYKALAPYCQYCGQALAFKKSRHDPTNAEEWQKMGS